MPTATRNDRRSAIDANRDEDASRVPVCTATARDERGGAVCDAAPQLAGPQRAQPYVGFSEAAPNSGSSR